VYMGVAVALLVTLCVASLGSINRALAPTLALTVLDRGVGFDNQSGAVAVPTNQLTVTPASPDDKTVEQDRAKAIKMKSATQNYSDHNVIATIFWLGEKPSADNGYITNTETEWDPDPVAHFGGYDDPNNRTARGLPVGFTPLHNPLYCALPVSEYDSKGNLVNEARSRSPWADQALEANQSLLKGRWIRVEKGGHVIFCQWLDSGPYVENDYDYVYGTAPPSNNIGEKAGIDLSPTAAFILGVNGSGTISWRFADPTEAAQTTGIWNDYLAINNINYW
jgi:hypothetical protein